MKKDITLFLWCRSYPEYKYYRRNIKEIIDKYNLNVIFKFLSPYDNNSIFGYHNNTVIFKLGNFYVYKKYEDQINILAKINDFKIYEIDENLDEFKLILNITQAQRCN